MKLKTPGFCFTGFLIMMLIPNVMKGFEKSMIRSLAEVMVSGAKAISDSYKKTKKLGHKNIYHVQN